MRWLAGHTKDVRAVAYTPDGRIVSAGSDKTVRVWDPATGECTATIKAKAPVYAVAVSPDGRTLAYGDRYAHAADRTCVYVCDLAGKPLDRYDLHFRIEVLERIPGTWEFERVIRTELRSVRSLAYSADGLYLAGACRRMGGGNIPNGGGGMCWELTLVGYQGGTVLPDDSYAIAFAPSAHRLAVSRHNAVQFHGEPRRWEDIVYPMPSEWSAAVAFVPGQDVAVVGSNRFLFFVNPARQEKVRKVKTGVRVVTGVAASPDGRTVLAGGKPGSVEVYDTAARTKTTAFDFGIGGVHGLAFAPDGLTFAVAGDKGLVVCDAPG